jgi:hypothetical protein
MRSAKEGEGQEIVKGRGGPPLLVYPKLERPKVESIVRQRAFDRCPHIVAWLNPKPWIAGLVSLGRLEVHDGKFRQVGERI